MNAIALSPPTPNPSLESLAEQAAKFAEAARARSTRRAYASDLRDFQDFCIGHGLHYLPSTPETVALYITYLASRVTVSTIRRRLAAITYHHRQMGCDSPATPRRHFLVREVLAGISRSLGVLQQGAEPILGDAVRRFVAACPENLVGIRDKALITLAYASGSRRSELASIWEVRDLTFSEQGLYIRMRLSKTDQEKAGRTIAIPFGEHLETCPVVSVRTWLDKARISEGPLFRAVDRHGNVSATALSTRSVAKIVKKAAARAGLDPARLSPHGLRSGMVTQAAINGAEECEIARITGHRSVAVLRKYVRDANLYRNNASARLGL
jgi:site-specific recombinase XerD